MQLFQRRFQQDGDSPSPLQRLTIPLLCEGAATQRYNKIAPAGAILQQFHQSFVFGVTEALFTLFRKNRCHGLAFATLNQLIKIAELPSKTGSQRASNARFTGAHKPDQKHTTG